MKTSPLLLFAWFSVVVSSSLHAGAVSVTGHVVLAKPFSGMTAPLREAGHEIAVEQAPSSTAAVYAVAEGKFDVALSSRPMTAQEKASFPERRMMDFHVANLAYTVAVTRDVWQSGVRALNQQQLTGIYDGSITNWKELGGEDRAIKFFPHDPARGSAELFLDWLYEDARRAPQATGEVVSGDPKELRDIMDFTSGSISMLPAAWVDGTNVFALALIGPEGKPVEPSLENLRNRRYPLARPLHLVFSERPSGDRRTLLMFLQSKGGQEVLGKAGFVSVPSTDP